MAVLSLMHSIFPRKEFLEKCRKMYGFTMEKCRKRGAFTMEKCRKRGVFTLEKCRELLCFWSGKVGEGK